MNARPAKCVCQILIFFETIQHRLIMNDCFNPLTGRFQLLTGLQRFACTGEPGNIDIGNIVGENR